jgi:hypothetical protein
MPDDPLRPDDNTSSSQVRPGQVSVAYRIAMSRIGSNRITRSPRRAGVKERPTGTPQAKRTQRTKRRSSDRRKRREVLRQFQPPQRWTASTGQRGARRLRAACLPFSLHQGASAPGRRRGWQMMPRPAGRRAASDCENGRPGFAPIRRVRKFTSAQAGDGDRKATARLTGRAANPEPCTHQRSSGGRTDRPASRFGTFWNSSTRPCAPGKPHRART